MTLFDDITTKPIEENKIASKLLTQTELNSYDHVIVALSGGKDSIACLLDIIETGVDLAKVELWHHDVDGREGSSLFDWPCTRDYCKKFAEALGLSIYYSWRKNGIEGEMLRDNSLTGNVLFETPTGLVEIPSTDREAYYNTRRKFPQIGGDLSTRWCSSYCKIDIAASALRNDERFHNKRVLFITGERGEESANRARYFQLEPHKADLREGKKFFRHIDHYRPVLHWKEKRVWAIIERFGVNPHPAYFLGFSRTSCMACIFLNADGFKTVSVLDPDRFERLARYEEEFGVTLKRNTSLRNLILSREVHKMEDVYIQAAMSANFNLPILLSPGAWLTPAGAYKGGCGPS